MFSAPFVQLQQFYLQPPQMLPMHPAYLQQPQKLPMQPYQQGFLQEPQFPMMPQSIILKPQVIVVPVSTCKCEETGCCKPQTQAPTANRTKTTKSRHHRRAEKPTEKVPEKPAEKIETETSVDATATKVDGSLKTELHGKLTEIISKMREESPNDELVTFLENLVQDDQDGTLNTMVLLNTPAYDGKEPDEKSEQFLLALKDKKEHMEDTQIFKFTHNGRNLDYVICRIYDYNWYFGVELPKKHNSFAYSRHALIAKYKCDSIAITGDDCKMLMFNIFPKKDHYYLNLEQFTGYMKSDRRYISFDETVKMAQQIAQDLLQEMDDVDPASAKIDDLQAIIKDLREKLAVLEAEKQFQTEQQQ